MYKKDKKYRVVIIVSGVNFEHPRILNDEIHGFGYNNGTITDDFGYTYGHGTAIYNIIRGQNSF